MYRFTAATTFFDAVAVAGATAPAGDRSSELGISTITDGMSANRFVVGIETAVIFVGVPATVPNPGASAGISGVDCFSPSTSVDAYFGRITPNRWNASIRACGYFFPSFGSGWTRAARTISVATD